MLKIIDKNSQVKQRLLNSTGVNLLSIVFVDGWMDGWTECMVVKRDDRRFE